MLKKDQITKIESLLKLPAGSLATAIADEKEVDVTIGELSVFTPEELTTRDANTKKGGYDGGKAAAIEMLVKEQREKLGLDFEGKDMDKLIEAFKEKTLKDAKIEPNQKINELNGIITNLRKTITDKDTEVTGLKGQIATSKQDTRLIGMFPANRLSVLNDTEYLASIRSQYTFEEEDGVEVVKKNGEILRDKTTQNPIKPEDIVGSYFTERKWVDEKQPGRSGRGAGNDTGKPGISTKLSELAKEWTDQGKSIQGSEFQAALEAAQKANPSFDLNG